MRFLGIDPGKDGGLVLLSQDGSLTRKWKTPLIKSAKARDEYDIHGLRDLVWNTNSTKGKLTIVLEKGQALPASMGGGLANFQRGLAFGIYQTIAIAFGIPLIVVPAQTWQKVMLVGVQADDTKAASVLVAKRLWPKENWKKSERSEKDDDGLTDAALVAEYGRRQSHTITASMAMAQGLV